MYGAQAVVVTSSGRPFIIKMQPLLQGNARQFAAIRNFRIGRRVRVKLSQGPYACLSAQDTTFRRTCGSGGRQPWRPPITVWPMP